MVHPSEEEWSLSDIIPIEVGGVVRVVAQSSSFYMEEGDVVDQVGEYFGIVLDPDEEGGPLSFHRTEIEAV